MHTRNSDLPYTSISQAMSLWVEIETAVGAKLSSCGQLQLVAPVEIEALFNNTVAMNPKRPKSQEFERRIESRKWF